MPVQFVTRSRRLAAAVRLLLLHTLQSPVDPLLLAMSQAGEPDNYEAVGEQIGRASEVC